MDAPLDLSAMIDALSQSQSVLDTRIQELSVRTSQVQDSQGVVNGFIQILDHVATNVSDISTTSTDLPQSK